LQRTKREILIFPSLYIYTAITQALAMLKSYRRLSRKVKNVSPPDVENLKTILLDDTHLLWFSWNSLKLATHKRHIVIPLRLMIIQRSVLTGMLRAQGL